MSTDLCACLVDENMDCTIIDTGNGSVYYISPGSGQTITVIVIHGHSR